MTALGKLPKALGPFFILCLLNRYAANAMLAEFGRDALVSRIGIMTVYLMGSLPTGIYYTVFYFSPALIAGLGWKLGTTFFDINIGMSTLVTIIGILWNRINVRQNECCKTVYQQESCSATVEKTDLIAAAKTAFRQFWDIAVVFMPITLAFALFMHTDILPEILAGLDPLLRWGNLTSAGVLVIVAGIPTLIAAIGVAGTLLQSGELAADEVIFTLLVASFCHNIYDSLSRVLPTNLSIFGAKMGVTVTVVSTVIYLAMVVLAAGITLYVKTQ
jgi:hypothetical protein